MLMLLRLVRCAIYFPVIKLLAPANSAAVGRAARGKSGSRERKVTVARNGSWEKLPKIESRNSGG